MTLTEKQKAWDITKAATRAEKLVGDAGRALSGRAERRAARRPARKQSGRTTLHGYRGVFNINTGRHEPPLPRPVHDEKAIAS